MERLIKVEGIGKKKVAANCIVMQFSIVKKMDVYDGLIEYAKKQYDIFLKGAKEIKIAASDIKTTNYVVNVEQKYDGREQTCDGYKISHGFTLQIPNDTARLSEIISMVENKKIDVTFNLQFTVEDKDALKNECIKLAVQDAKTKAENIAASLGLKLGEFVEANYGCGQKGLYSSHARVMPLAASGGGLDFTVDDVDVSEEVTVVWNATEKK